MLDNDLLMAFRAEAESGGAGYLALINQTLRQAAGSLPVDEATLRRGKTQRATDAMITHIFRDYSGFADGVRKRGVGPDQADGKSDEPRI